LNPKLKLLFKVPDASSKLLQKQPIDASTHTSYLCPNF